MSNPYPPAHSPTPREKLAEFGSTTLSDAELLAVMLGSGSKGHNVHRISQALLPVLDLLLPDMDVAKLQEVPGMGPSKAYLISAAFEFARRRIRPEATKISSAKDVYSLLQHIVDRSQEHVIVISLNGAHEVIKIRTVAIGILNRCLVHPREVFSEPMKDRCCSIIVAHNHPSGNPQPSEDDKIVTRQLRSAGETLGIRLLDHVIVARRGYHSFQENGEL